jgi:hypothetical protein
MKKEYRLKIGEDMIYFTSVEISQSTGLALSESDQARMNIFSSVDTVIDITNLETVPLVGSIWNGESFSSNNAELLDQPISDLSVEGIKTHRDYHRFAFLENNTLLGSFYYRKDREEHAALVAALSSSPSIVENIVI